MRSPSAGDFYQRGIAAEVCLTDTRQRMPEQVPHGVPQFSLRLREVGLLIAHRSKLIAHSLSWLTAHPTPKENS